MISNQFFSCGKEYSTAEKHIPAPYIRKTFIVGNKYEKAKLTVTALGFYKLFINGKEITKGYMAPYVSNPEHILVYDEYDLSECLDVGKNVIALILGNGYQNCVGGYIWNEHIRTGRGAPAFALSLELNGEVFFEADESFKWTRSPILFDDMRLGEIYDANKEIDRWNEIDFDDSDWERVLPITPPKGEKIIGDIEPVSERKRLSPVAIIPKNTGYLYDFGENTSAVLKMEINADKGQIIECIYGEWLNSDGELDISNISFLRNDFERENPFCQKTKYICKDGYQTYIPSFSYQGFRYVYVTGIKKEQANSELFTAIAVNSKLEPAGYFKSSDEKLNKTQNLCMNSAYTNFQYYPLDCPHREKNGWTMDANVSTEYMLYGMYAENSLRQWLHSLRNTMRSDGKVPSVVPDCGFGIGRNDGPAWDNVIIQMPYIIYSITQNITILEENAEKIFKYVTYISNHLENGLITYGLSDWCQPLLKPWENKTPKRVSGTMIVYKALRQAMEIFEKLKLEREYDYTRSLSEYIKKSAREKLIDFDTYEVEGGQQTCQALAIWADIFEENEKRKALEVLLDKIKANDNRLDVGVIGMWVMLPVLSEFGYIDLVYDMITTDKYPSYGYMLNQGATSLWEQFYTEDDLLGKGSLPDSLNHHMFGSVSAWFMKYLGGIKFNFDGSVKINPIFASKVDYVEASTRGIKVKWERKNGEIKTLIDYDQDFYKNRKIMIN